jgi:hypothetical protein
MSDSSVWNAFARSGVTVAIAEQRVVLSVAGGSVRLLEQEARAAGLAILGFAHRVRRGDKLGASHGRLLAWSDDGCHIGDEREPITEGDPLYLYGKDGWARGVCVSATTAPLLEIAEGVVYLRPESRIAGPDTLVRRTRSLARNADCG